MWKLNIPAALEGRWHLFAIVENALRLVLLGLLWKWGRGRYAHKRTWTETRGGEDPQKGVVRILISKTVVDKQDLGFPMILLSSL